MGHGHQQREAAVKVIHDVESGAESLGGFFAMEDRLRAKSNPHADDLELELG